VTVDLGGNWSEPPTTVVNDENRSRVTSLSEDAKSLFISENARSRGLISELRSVTVGSGDRHEHPFGSDIASIYRCKSHELRGFFRGHRGTIGMSQLPASQFGQSG